MLYLRKNEKNIEVNKTSGKNLPYFSLLVVPSDENKKLDWDKALEIGAFWKVKTGGNGYTGQFHKDFEFDASQIKPFKKSGEKQESND